MVDDIFSPFSSLSLCTDDVFLGHAESFQLRAVRSLVVDVSNCANQVLFRKTFPVLMSSRLFPLSLLSGLAYLI